MKHTKLAIRLLKWYMNKGKEKEVPPFKNALDIDPTGKNDFFSKFDIFYANEENRKNKVVINIHGGSYLFNNRKFNFDFVKIFLNEGYDVVLLDYPQNKGRKTSCFDQLNALAVELNYLAKHHEELNLSDNFYIVGDSAGGHYTILLSEAACNKSLQEELEIDLGLFKVKASVAICPVYDFEQTIALSPMTKGARDLMFGKIFRDTSEVKRISPRTHIESLNIPIQITTCKRDFLIANSLYLKEDLERLNKKYEYVYIDSDRKEIEHVHNVVRLSQPESIEVNNKIIDFLNRH